MYWFISTTHPRKPTDPLILPICSSCFFREIKFRRSGLEHPTGWDGVVGLIFIMCIYRHMWWNSSSYFSWKPGETNHPPCGKWWQMSMFFWVMRLRHTSNFNWRLCSCSFPTNCNNDDGILTTLTAAGTVFNKCPKLAFLIFFHIIFGHFICEHRTPHKSPYVIKIWYALLFSNWW